MPKSRQQQRARSRSSALQQRRRGTLFFTSALIVLVAAGGAGAFFSRSHPPPLTRGASVGEHWHASYRIYLCGKRVANYPTVEGQLHSHGDGFIHDHPSDATASGDNASLGTFLRLYETTFTQTNKGKRQMIFPTGKKLTDGDRCSDHKKYNWIFTNKDKTIKGDPSTYLPHDRDVLVMQFGPRGSKQIPNPYSLIHPEAGVGRPEAPGTTPGPDTAQIPQIPLPSVPAGNASPKPSG